jgi:hypothetical protein
MPRRMSAAVVTAAMALALVLSGIPRTAHAGTPFTDISASPFKNDIVWAYDEGITGGCAATRFCPTAAVTRDQMASFLDRMFGFPSTSVDFFTDDEGNQHEGAINRLAAAGVTGGCTTGKYCPTNAVTREQMASFIARAAELPFVSINPFYDDDFRPHETDINRIAAEGIGSGCGAYKFCPGGTISREQMVAFLHRVEVPVSPPAPFAPCDRSYTPYLCIPSPPPNLDCSDISHRNFFVRAPDPHEFDGNDDGVGCETP